MVIVLTAKLNFGRMRALIHEIRIALTALVFLSAGILSVPAQALEPDSPAALEEALDGVGSLTGAVAGLSPSSEGFICSLAGDVVTIPEDRAAGMELDLGAAGEIGLGLPGGPSAEDAMPLDGGTVTYDHANPDVTLAAEAPLAGGVCALIVNHGSRETAATRRAPSASIGPLRATLATPVGSSQPPAVRAE